jgi:hypothetical protein
LFKKNKEFRLEVAVPHSKIAAAYDCHLHEYYYLEDIHDGGEIKLFIFEGPFQPLKYLAFFIQRKMGLKGVMRYQGEFSSSPKISNSYAVRGE